MRGISCILLCLVGGTVLAEPLHPALTDTWQLNLSALNQKSDVRFSSTFRSDELTKINLKNLGLDDSEVVPQFGARWRVNNRWALNFSYSGFDVRGSKTVDKTFNFDGVEYPVSAALKTKLDINLYIFALNYSIGTSDTTEWGIGLGVHAIEFSTKISASLNDLALDASSATFLAPLPNVRLFTRHAFSPRLFAHASIGWISVKAGKYDGALLVGTATLAYRVTNRWSLGLNYQVTDINLDIDRAFRNSAYHVKFDGFSMIVKYSIP